jgi:hypothetical protein
MFVPMSLSRALGLAVFTITFWCGYERMAISQSALNDSNKALDTTKQAGLAAELVFTHAEPVQQPLLIRDERLELVNLKLWFKNEGQAPARLLTLGTMPVLTDKILTQDEEENYLDVAAKQWSIKLDGEVQPGQTAFFTSQNGIDDQGWAEFQAKRKYLYSFLTVTYRAENSASRGEVVTETCVWFQNADVSTANTCRSGHNQATLRGK